MTVDGVPRPRSAPAGTGHAPAVPLARRPVAATTVAPPWQRVPVPRRGAVRLVARDGERIRPRLDPSGPMTLARPEPGTAGPDPARPGSTISGPTTPGSTVAGSAAEPTVSRSAAEPTVSRSAAEPTVSRSAAEPTVSRSAVSGPTATGSGPNAPDPGRPDTAVYRPAVQRARPPVVEDPGILGLSRLTRGRVGSRLFTLFFVAVFALIAVQTLVELVYG